MRLHSPSHTDSGTATETTDQLHWQLTGDTAYLNRLYTSQLQTARDRQFVNREGSLWIDRIYYNNGELQRGRLGGVALMRDFDFPGNVVRWRFDPTPSNPTPDTSVGILVPIGTPTHIHILAYNMDKAPLTAQMTGGQIDPGQWQLTQCTTNSASPEVCSSPATTTLVAFERSSALPITFAPGVTTVLDLTLKQPGVPYWQRPDLGLSTDDVTLTGHTLHVIVHSLGAIDTPPATLILRNAAGKTLATAAIPSLKAPLDLTPKTTTLALPALGDIPTDTLTIESTGPTPEITQLNNHIAIGSLDHTPNPAEIELHNRR